MCSFEMDGLSTFISVPQAAGGVKPMDAPTGSYDGSTP
jgi:hypothetical protein